MRFVFRFRTVTAILLLICVAVNAIWLPKGVSWQSLASFSDAWLVPLAFGQAHSGVVALALILACLLALVLLFMPVYSVILARVVLICVVLILLTAFVFQLVLPALWLLPLWASWRLSGRPGVPVKA